MSSNGHGTLLVGAQQDKLPWCKLDGHNHAGSGVMMILVCHMIPQDYVIKGSSDFMGGSHSW